MMKSNQKLPEQSMMDRKKYRASELSSTIPQAIGARSEKVSCKKVVGQTICRVGSTAILPKEPVTINVYTSSDCKWCPKEIIAFQKSTKNIKPMVKIFVKNVEEMPNIEMDALGIFPVADFGNGIIERGRISKLDDATIVGKVLESARAGRAIQNFRPE